MFLKKGTKYTAKANSLFLDYLFSRLLECSCVDITMLALSLAMGLNNNSAKMVVIFKKEQTKI